MLDDLITEKKEEDLVSKEIELENISSETELEYAKAYANKIHALSKKNGWVMAEYFADMTKRALDCD